MPKNIFVKLINNLNRQRRVIARLCLVNNLMLAVKIVERPLSETKIKNLHNPYTQRDQNILVCVLCSAVIAQSASIAHYVIYGEQAN